MQEFLLFLILLAVIGVSTSDFDPAKSKCLVASHTLYTNVGTVVLDKDGKTIPCEPPPKKKEEAK